MSTFHITPGVAAEYLNALRRYRIRYVFGYASAMSALASALRAKGLVASDLAVAISNAEPVDAFQRDLISSVFQCPVRDTYGQAEIVSGASECASGALHMWPEVGVTEWVRDDSYEPIAVGEAGRMLCTGLLNMDMPLIRYELGDRSTRAEEDPGCPCGRGLPTIRAVEGRSFDVALTPDGVPVGSLGTIFHSGLPMREAQIIQETLTRFRIKVVPAPGFSEKHAQDLRRGLQSRIGESVEVIVETVDSDRANARGKISKADFPAPGPFRQPDPEVRAAERAEGADPMRIGILTQYYPPEMGAPQARLSHLAGQLVRRGHEVVVLTAMPNYPRGRVFPGYGGLWRREERDGVKVLRCGLYPTVNVRMAPRLASYFSFVLSSLLVGAFGLPKLDYLLTESPPLFLGISGYLLARRTGARWIFNVSDLWPESAVALGAVSEGPGLRASRRLEAFCYRKAWLVTGQSREILKNIQDRFPSVPVYHLSNGVDTDLFRPERRSPGARARLSNGRGAPNGCVAMYAGLHGIAQGLDQILEAASKLADLPSLEIALVGDGP